MILLSDLETLEYEQFYNNFQVCRILNRRGSEVDRKRIETPCINSACRGDWLSLIKTLFRNKTSFLRDL